jgi:hypothetical protein
MLAPRRSVGILTTASVLLLFIGWFAGRALHASYAPAPRKAAEPTPAVTSAPPDAGPEFRGTASLAERIDRISKQLTNVQSGTETAMAAFALAETLQSDEFPAAIATSASSTNFRGAQTLLFGYWVERDLEKALAWYKGLEANKQSTFSGSLLDTWSNMDPRTALAWLEKQPEAERDSILQAAHHTIASRIGPIEPDRVLALLMPIAGDSGIIGRESGIGLPAFITPSISQSGVYVFFAALAEKVPSEAAARALKLPSGTHRTSAAIAVMLAWAKQNPTEAKAWAEKIDDAALAAQVIPAFALGLAEKDPRQAADWLGTMSATQPNRQAMKEILDMWGQKDLGAALAWLDSLPPDSGAEELTGAVFKTLNQQDPVKALDVMKRRLDENKPLGEDFTGWIGVAYVEAKGAKEAMRFAETSLQHENSFESLSAFRSLVSAAARQLPRETAEWALQQLPGTRRGAALKLAGESLVQENEESGYRWINSLPKDIDSDEARLEVAYRFFRKDPEKGASLLAGLTNQKDAQERLFNCTCWGLVGNKAREVEDWLQGTSILSADQKARIRKAVADHKKQSQK